MQRCNQLHGKKGDLCDVEVLAPQQSIHVVEVNGEKHEKSQLKHSKYHFNLPELVRDKDTPIAPNLLHGF